MLSAWVVVLGLSLEGAWAAQSETQKYAALRKEQLLENPFMRVLMGEFDLKPVAIDNIIQNCNGRTLMLFDPISKAPIFDRELGYGMQYSPVVGTQLPPALCGDDSPFYPYYFETPMYDHNNASKYNENNNLVEFPLPPTHRLEQNARCPTTPTSDELATTCALPPGSLVSTAAPPKPVAPKPKPAGGEFTPPYFPQISYRPDMYPEQGKLYDACKKHASPGIQPHFLRVCWGSNRFDMWDVTKDVFSGVIIVCVKDVKRNMGRLPEREPYELFWLKNSPLLPVTSNKVIVLFMNK